MKYENYLNKDVNYIVSELVKEFPEKNVEALEQNTITTMEFREDRIRVWYEEDTKLVTGITEG